MTWACCCCSVRACCLLVAFSTLPLRLTLSAAATDGRVVTFRAALIGEETGAGAGAIRAFFELLGGVCFRLEESLAGVVEAFLGGRPRFLGAGVSTAACAALVADFGGLPRRLGVGVGVATTAAFLGEAFLGGRPRGRPVEVGLLADFGAGAGGLATTAAALAAEDRLVLWVLVVVFSLEQEGQCQDADALGADVNGGSKQYVWYSSSQPSHSSSFSLSFLPKQTRHPQKTQSGIFLSSLQNLQKAEAVLLSSSSSSSSSSSASSWLDSSSFSSFFFRSIRLRFLDLGCCSSSCSFSCSSSSA
mmetsp:Transcript_44967/g.108705  ORF Transcript_44967/g.108705 Transcript_44967/m.108705 type:complete len:303 (+) Transcript_44967:1171-2079(+)